jgi:serine/threonine protein kinase
VVPLEQPDELVPPERVAREAQALARLSHPQIVTIYEVRRAADHLCLLMELVEGGNLRQRLRRGPLDPAEMVPLVQQICAGLAHAHAQGVVHRDIKPENILLAADGTAKIADFGLAKMAPRGSVLSPVLTRSGQVMGSAHYVAPEQLEMMEQVDQRADLYALGVMLYEMLTGTRPAIDYRPPSRLRPLDWRYDAVVQRLLRRNPADRYPTAEAVAEQIRKSAGSATPPRRRWLVGGALAAAAVVEAHVVLPHAV